VALAWPNHVHHERALDWFERDGVRSWATCPFTQSAFVRVSSNVRAVPQAKTPHEAIELLRRILRLPGHTLLVDDVSITDDALVAHRRLVGYQQVSDAHLLAVALRHGAQVATLDRGFESIVPPAYDPQEVLAWL
jgi:hypothetical protein